MLLSGATWAVAWGREPELPLDEAAGRRFGAGLVLLPLGGLFWAASTAVSSLVWEAGADPWTQQVNPGVVLLVSGVVVLAAVGAQLARVRLPAMAVLGASLILLLPGGGLGLMLTPGGSVALVAATVALLALPEALLGAFAFSRLTGDLPSRLTPLLVAGWMACTYLGGMVPGWLTLWLSPSLVAGIFLSLALVGGVVALGLWVPLERFAFRPAALRPGDEDGEDEAL